MKTTKKPYETPEIQVIELPDTPQLLAKSPDGIPATLDDWEAN